MDIVAANPITNFGCTLVTELFTNAPGNVVVSPYSLWTALSMAESATAEGSNAKAELCELLRYDCVQGGDVTAWYCETRKNMATLDPKVALKVANAIFAEGDIEPEFVKKCNDLFESDVMPLETRFNINDFVSKNTDKMIPQLLSRDPSGPAVLINAVYFKASWATQFDRAETTRRYFTHFDGKRTNCTMMTKYTKMDYYKIMNIQMIKLSYGDNAEFGAFIVLPNESGRDSMNKAVRQLFGSVDNWAIATDEMRRQKVKLCLPRFTVDGGTDLIKEYMEKKGVSAVFKPGGVLGLTGSPVDRISDVVHKAVISVDERGTVATGCTAVCTSRSISVDPMVLVDRPFIFTVVHNKTKTLLFAACINSV